MLSPLNMPSSEESSNSVKSEEEEQVSSDTPISSAESAPPIESVTLPETFLEAHEGNQRSRRISWLPKAYPPVPAHVVLKSAAATVSRVDGD